MHFGQDVLYADMAVAGRCVCWCVGRACRADKIMDDLLSRSFGIRQNKMYQFILSPLCFSLVNIK